MARDVEDLRGVPQRMAMESGPSSEQASEAFRTFLLAMQEHQKMALACAQQQEKAVSALADMELSVLAEICAHYRWLPRASTVQSNGAFHSQRPFHSPRADQHIQFADPEGPVAKVHTTPSFKSQPSTTSVALMGDGVDAAASKVVERLVAQRADPDANNSLTLTEEFTVRKNALMHRGSTSEEDQKHARGISEVVKAKLHMSHDLADDILKPPQPQVQEELGGMEWSKPIRRWLRTRSFELVCTGVMLANVLAMILRLELDGRVAGEELGVIKNSGVKQATLIFMEDLELFFTSWFTVELLLRFWAFGCGILMEAMSLFDVLVVLGTLLDIVLNRLYNVEGGMNLSLARMIRMLKVLKFLRTFKAASAFTELRILLRTVMRSTMALLWALIVLSMIILTCSNFMAQLLSGFISDSGNNLEVRLWLFEYYGTATRAAYTMLEATLSGGWPNYARVLVMEVSPLWALWWFFYVFVVIFAVIRVMGALFLTASLKAASEDADMQALRRIKDFERGTKQLQDIFMDNEVLGLQDWEDQNLSKEEIEDRQQKRRCYLLRTDLIRVLQNPSSLAKLNNQGFEAIEFRLLFDIVSGGEDRVPWALFLKSAMRLKGGVKAIDVIEILHEVELLKKSFGMTAESVIKSWNPPSASLSSMSASLQ
mmetsp:Transcript_17962/g.41916  ORF Transcript_17962/g.41916 Transcript_17962/m.41916 type:complete len:656 (-) Transcript_17962:258-2225(-)